MPFLFLGRGRPSRSTAPRDTVALDLPVAQREFAEVYRRLHRKACRFAKHFVNDDAEDAVHDAFADLWASCFANGEVDLEGVDSLFVKILRRRIADRLRDERRSARRDADEDTVVSISSRLENQVDTARVADGSLLASHMSYVVESMPFHCRRVYQIASANGWNARVAARELNITYNTARWHLTRAVAFIRAALERGGYDVPATLPLGRRGRRET